MSDNQHPEEMRPIPDGGLKDAMPSWLKRPPAWRSMPTSEQRHERALPEPDTSEIDPKTLVDVNDLPQWLQTIAARGDEPLPEPDEAVGHALEQVQAATVARTRPDEPEVVADELEEAETPGEAVLAEATEQPDAGISPAETSSNLAPTDQQSRPSMFLPATIVALGCIVLVFGLILYFFL